MKILAQLVIEDETLFPKEKTLFIQGKDRWGQDREVRIVVGTPEEIDLAEGCLYDTLNILKIIPEYLEKES